MVVVAVVMLYPFYYMLDNAFRTAAQFDQQSRPLRQQLGDGSSRTCPWRGSSSTPR